MDAGLQPLLPSCGVNDVDAASSAACGQDMQAICSQGWGDASNGGTLKSMLLNPQSNCWKWMVSIQEANAVLQDKALAPGTPFLDAAMHSFCRGANSAGSLTAECACLSFPQRAASWCSVSHCALGAQWDFLSLSSDNQQDREAACPAIEFGQERAGAQELDVVQFGNCSPYPCWLSDCFKTPSQQLLSSQVLQTQMSGQCPQICGQFLEGNKVTLSPMPPGSFSFTGDVSGISGCCVNSSSYTCAPYPAQLSCEKTTWAVPSNARMVFPTVVSNNGDDIAFLTFSSCSVPFCSVQPNTVAVVSHGVAQFNVVCDQASLSTLFSKSVAQGSSTLELDPELYFSYPDLSQVGQPSRAWSASCGISVSAASGPIHKQVTALPPWFWIVVCLAVVVAVALLVWSFQIERSARAYIAQLPLSNRA